IEGGLWAGYLNVSVMVAWLTLGLVAALAVILIGAPAAAIIDYYVNVTGERPSTLRDRLAATTLSRITISGIALLTASTIFTLLGGDVPFHEMETYGLA